jgi:hypothetical protein
MLKSVKIYPQNLKGISKYWFFTGLKPLRFLQNSYNLEIVKKPQQGHGKAVNITSGT